MTKGLLPIGTSDFRQIRREEALYVDKTALVSQVLNDAARVLLLPRPRRFGKTTALSMLRYFFERRAEDLAPLFEGLAVWRDEAARAHFGRYPVIYLTFKEIKATSWDECLSGMTLLLADLYGAHADLLPYLSEEEAASFRAIRDRRADQAELRRSLRALSEYLARRHEQPVVILIDEYDTPLHAAFFNGYFDEAIGLFRGFLSGAFKDNEFLFKGVLTGILRVARESIFSDLNNLDVYSLLHPRYAPYFGFTEAEVEDLARRAGFTGSLEALREWYNGYLFGGVVIYNPWSVLSAINRGTCEPYWVNTSSNEMIRELVMRATVDQHAELEAVLSGASVRKRLTENTALREVYSDSESIWSFLVFSGYLRAHDVRQEEDASTTAALSIPNRELRAVFSHLFDRWLSVGLGGGRQVEDMTRALLRGDVAEFEQHLSRLLVESASTMDTIAPRGMPPEQLYHVFLLGLLIFLQPRYAVRSNRESGFGRSDVMIVPRQPGQPGVVLELKVKRRGQTLAQATSEGLRQLKERAYAAELRALGATPIHEIAVAFDGKRVLVKAAKNSAARPAAKKRAKAGGRPAGKKRSKKGS